MRILMCVAMTAFLLPVVAVFAADVEYQHPNITIVANDEPLDVVLKAVSREMHIFVTMPDGFNPIVKCDIQSQPLEKAFKILMGDMSYSLEWKNDGQQLAGVTILSGSDEPGAAADGGSSAAAASPANQVSGMPGAAHSAPSAELQSEPDTDRLLPAAPDNAVAAEPVNRDDGLNTGGEAQDVAARKLEEREIELELRRQEEVIAREAGMEEEEARNQAEMAEYFETFGISPNP